MKSNIITHVRCGKHLFT